MTVVVLGALVVVGIGGYLWWMGRDVVGSRSEIDQRIDARLTTRLDEAGGHIGRPQAEVAWPVDTGIRDVDDAVARIVGDQAQLDQRLDVVETWVRHRAQQVES